MTSSRIMFFKGQLLLLHVFLRMIEKYLVCVVFVIHSN